MYPQYSGVPLDRATLDHMNLAYEVGPSVLYPGFESATPVPALPWVGVVLLALILLVSARRTLTLMS